MSKYPRWTDCFGDGRKSLVKCRMRILEPQCLCYGSSDRVQIHLLVVAHCELGDLMKVLTVYFCTLTSCQKHIQYCPG